MGNYDDGRFTLSEAEHKTVCDNMEVILNDLDRVGRVVRRIEQSIEDLRKSLLSCDRRWVTKEAWDHYFGDKEWPKK